MDHHFYFSDWLTQSEGERVVMRRKERANFWSAMKIWETVLRS